MSRKIVSMILTLIMIANFSVFSTIQVFAHSFMLDVTYDECVASKLGDSVYEMWYVLADDSDCCHLSDQVNTIKYYFVDNPNGKEPWSKVTDAEEIQNAYANSMMKWNNVYFYSYDSSGNVVKNKIINVIEGTENDHNLSIYPDTSTNLAAYTGYNGYYMPEIDNNIHKHCTSWEMGINIPYFSTNSKYGEDVVNAMREKTGAHEIGHVLGLRDLDFNNQCKANADEEHHYELLMGYGEEIIDRAQDITYKDIAGVAITRGFHTDNDHQWIKHGQQSDGTYKMVCSICNGVKYVESLNGYSYVTYGSCAGNHDLGIGYMIPVASYGTKDYYKCKYCSYVAPFSLIVEQDYTKSNYSHTHHKCLNNVPGLGYTFYEEHNIVDNECLGCGELIHSYTDSYAPYSTTQHKAYCECGEYILQEHIIYNDVCNLCGTVHSHEYTEWEYYSNTYHIEKCICGERGTTKKVHAVSSTELSRYKTCILCGGTVDTFSDISQIESTVRMVTTNGSYILPSGIIVLVDADIEAYFSGELVFYNPNDNLEDS